MGEKKININEWLKKGSTLIRSGENYEAMRWFHKALEIDPKIKDSWVGKGTALTNLE